MGLSFPVVQLLFIAVSVSLMCGAGYFLSKEQYKLAISCVVLLLIGFTMMPVRTTVDNTATRQLSNREFSVEPRVEVEQLPFEERQKLKLNELSQQSEEVHEEITRDDTTGSQ